MIYVGNFAEWVQQEWVDYLLHTDGTLRPKSSEHNPDSEEFRIATAAGYDLSQIYWHHYDEKSCPIKPGTPFDVGDKKILWWFIKLTPGKFMPMHRDPHTLEYKNPKRYWMALQDYQPGHIFMYNDQALTGYKKGDLYCYPDAQEVHGACNIGYTPRLTYLLTVYDK
jgi:hypothetical protein